MARKSDEEWMELIGARIYRWRALSGLTLEEVANKAGLQLADLARVEKGQLGLSLQSLWQISLAMQVGPENFLTIDTDSVAVLGQIGNGHWNENPIQKGWIYPLPVRRNPRFSANSAFEISKQSKIAAGGADGWVICSEWNHLVMARAGLRSGDRFVVVRRHPRRRRFLLELSLREYMPPDGSLREETDLTSPWDEGGKSLAQRREEAWAIATAIENKRQVIAFDAAAMRKREREDGPGAQRQGLPKGLLSCVGDIPDNPEDHHVLSDDPSIVWIWQVVSEFRYVR